MSAIFIRGVMRRLTSRFSRAIELMNPGIQTRNLDTGNVTRSFTRKSLQAIVLPMKEERDFVYDLSFIAANKNFTYGGQFQIERINVLIDTVRLSGFVVKETTIVMVNGQPHTIEKIINEWAGGHYVMVQCLRTEKANLGRVGIVPVPIAMPSVSVPPTVS